MPSQAKVVITDTELGKALRRKGASLDKYVEARQKLGVSPTRARVIASTPRLHIDAYAAAVGQGLNHAEIMEIVSGPFNLQVVVTLLDKGDATLDEALEACEAFVPIMGSYSYERLRGPAFNLTHHVIVDSVIMANKAGADKEKFLALAYEHGVNEAHALEAATARIDPHIYMHAVQRLGHSHEDIMASCASYHETREFERDIYATIVAGS